MGIPRRPQGEATGQAEPGSRAALRQQQDRSSQVQGRERPGFRGSTSPTLRREAREAVLREAVLRRAGRGAWLLGRQGLSSSQLPLPTPGLLKGKKNGCRLRTPGIFNAAAGVGTGTSAYAPGH